MGFLFLFSPRSKCASLHTSAFRHTHLRRVSEYVYLRAAAPCFIISLHEAGRETGLFFDGHDTYSTRKLLARLNPRKGNTRSGSLREMNNPPPLLAEPGLLSLYLPEPLQGKRGCSRL